MNTWSSMVVAGYPGTGCGRPHVTAGMTRRTRSRTAALAGVALLALGACTTDAGAPVSGPPPDSADGREAGRTGGWGGVRRQAVLERFDSCDALLGWLRTEAADLATPWGVGGPAVIRPTLADGAATGREKTGAVAMDAATAAGEGGGASSATNTQEAGIDEGDLVETDGRHLWSVLDGRLRVIDVTEGRTVADVELPGDTHRLLLDGNRLVVVSSTWSGVMPFAAATVDDTARAALPVVVGPATTLVSLFDVADPASMRLVGRTQFEGEVVATRAAEGVVRLVVRSPLGAGLPLVMPASPAGVEAAERYNRDVMAAADVDDWLPRRWSVGADGSAGPASPVLACDEVLAPATASGLGLLWVAELAFASDGDVDGTAGVVSSGETVYASAANLFVATTRWPVPDDPTDGVAQPAPDAAAVPSVGWADPWSASTLVHRFAIDDAGGGTRYAGSGEVPGSLLNQFAMSEWDGVLRVALTADVRAGDGSVTTESAVRVLRIGDDGLSEVGVVTGLGRTETIHAVRFLGDQGYVVTFRQTDPLYVIDLRDPANPAMTGELKIPGYSAYLHPVAPGMLVGVGQDADLDGRVTGAQLSLFDVRDPAAPQRIATLDLGGSSAAEWDHHAFLWWPDATAVAAPDAAAAGTVVVPTQQWGDGQGGWWHGAVVAHVDGGQLAERGRVTHGDLAAGGPGDGTGAVQRALVVDGRLVTVSLAGVLVSDLAALESVHWVPTP